MKLFKRKHQIQSIEFELIQLRLHLSYQMSLWEQIAEKIGVEIPKTDLYKEAMEKISRAMTDYEMDLLNNLLPGKED